MAVGEGLLVFDTNGASGSILHRGTSGPAPEGDKARQLEISADGSRVAVTHILSDTVGIYDAASGTLLRMVEVGDSPCEVALTPDASLAVVANQGASKKQVVGG